MNLRVPPLPFEMPRAQRTLADLQEVGFTPPDAAARALLAGAFGNSPYLARLALRDPEGLADFFARGAAAMVADATAQAAPDLAKNADLSRFIL